MVLLAVVLALVVGVPVGMLSGYLGGGVDRVLVLLMDTLYTLPVLLLSVVLAFLLGRGIPIGIPRPSRNANTTDSNNTGKV